jgi:CRP-like cAMP-binding protein
VGRAACGARACDAPDPLGSSILFDVTPVDPSKIQALRDAWETAIGKDRPKDALAALEGLELLEPHEARWPHRKGDVLRRLGKPGEAEESFVRAVRCYVGQGFFTRAAALAKAVVDANPARRELLDELNPAPAKKLRDEVKPPVASPALEPRIPRPPRPPSGTMDAVRGPIAMPPARHEESFDLPKSAAVLSDPRARGGAGRRDVHDDFADDDLGLDFEFDHERDSSIAGVRVDRISVVAAAMGLAPAKDASDDEVRFEDVPDVYAMSIDVDMSELEQSSARDSTPELEVGEFPDAETPTALRLTLMSAATLFVDVPKAAMSEMVAAAQLQDMAHGARIYRAGEPSDGLYVVVEGKVDLFDEVAKKKMVVSEGSVFGEDALLQGGVRSVSARVNGRLLALKIPKSALDGIVKRHLALGDVLFNVLVRRLVTMALQTSELFAAFDVATRKELARLFEVRRAAPGTVIKQRGKRSDGLYLPLAGELEMDDGASKGTLPLGAMFGHTSLLSDAPEQRTITTRKESVVLRLPAARFVAFAARFPAALAHLAELAQRPRSL